MANSADLRLLTDDGRDKKRWVLVSFYYGFAVIFAQVCVLREYITFCHGSEFYLSFFFLVWLVSGAIGSVTAGRFILQATNKHHKVAFLFPLFSILFLWLGASIFSFRDVQGLVIPFSDVSLFCLVSVAPIAFLSGSCFSILVRHIEPRSAYALEAFGTMVGGILLDTLIMPVCGNFLSLVLLSAFGAFLLFERFAKYFAVALILLLLAFVPRIERTVLEKQEIGELVTVEHTRAGRMTLRKIESEKLVYFDGVPMVSSSLVAETLFTLAEGIGGEKSVLIVSQNTSALEAVAKSRKWRFRSFVSDAPTALFLRKYLSTETTADDVRSFAAHTNERFSAALIELPVPSSVSANRMMSVEFFKALSRVCGGFIIAVSYPEGAPPASYKFFLKALLNAIQKAVKESLDTVELLKIESSGLVITTFPIENLNTHPFGNIAPFELTLLKKSLDEISVNVNTDTNLLCARYGIAYHSQRLEIWFLSLLFSAPSTILFVGVLVLLLASTGGFSLANENSDNAVLFSTGIVAITVQLVLLLLFQSTFGMVYGAIGVLVALFMVGNGLGALVAKKLSPSNRNILLVLIAYIVLVTVIVFFSYSFRSGMFSLFLFFLFNGVSGFIVGLRFGVLVKRVRPSVAYGTDLLGAAAGTATAFLLLPSCGVILTLLFLLILLVAVILIRFISQR